MFFQLGNPLSDLGHSNPLIDFISEFLACELLVEDEHFHLSQSVSLFLFKYLEEKLFPIENELAVFALHFVEKGLKLP